MPSIDSGLTSTGVIIGVKPYSTACCDGQLQQAELQQRARRRSGSRTGCPTPSRRARCRSRRSTSPSSRWSRGCVDARACRRPRAARRSRPRRRAARRPRPRWAPRSCARRSACSASVDGGLGRLHLGRQLLGTGQQRGPLVAGGLRHLLAELLLLGPQRLEPLHGRPARLVGGAAGRPPIGLGLAAGPLAGPDGVGIFAEQTQVNHEPRAYPASSTASPQIRSRAARAKASAGIIVARRPGSRRDRPARRRRR